MYVKLFIKRKEGKSAFSEMTRRVSGYRRAPAESQKSVLVLGVGGKRWI